jgi:hypothetical protein
MQSAPPAAPVVTTPSTGPTSTVAAAHTPYVPMSRSRLIRPEEHEEDFSISNRSAWLSLLFGLVAAGLTVVSFLPGSAVLWVGASGLIAILWGVRALVRKRANRATNVWAPVVGMLLGIAATVFMLFGIAILSALHIGAPSTTAANAASIQPTVAQTSPTPFVFTSNAPLTASETETQQIAMAINNTFAAGSTKLAPGQAWPALLSVSGTSVVAPNGTTVATLPDGMSINYKLVDNKTGYEIAVSSGDLTEIAIYDSTRNVYGFQCATNDPDCVPTK